MNVLIITGNVTKDSEVRATGSGKRVLNFTLANNQGYGDNKRTEYYDCALWGDRADKLAQYITKGTKLTVQGEHSTEKSEHNGKTFFRNKVFVRAVELGGRPKGEQAQRQSGAAPQAEFDDDLPFVPVRSLYGIIDYWG